MRCGHSPVGPRAFAVTLAHLRFVLAIVLSVAAGDAVAADREYVLRFLPPEDAQVDGFQVHLAPAGSPFGEPRDVGFVAPDAEGIARTTLRLDSTITYQVGMTAYNAAGESDLSNLLVVGALACDPGLCEDGNACTADACKLAGCSHAALVDGTACDDGFSTTRGDRCLGGECLGKGKRTRRDRSRR